MQQLPVSEIVKKCATQGTHQNYKGDGDISSHGRIEYPDGRIYTGSLKDGVKHGFGTMVYPDGTRYVGSWKDDLPHGRGRVTFPNGRVRRGVWVEGEYVEEDK